MKLNKIETSTLEREIDGTVFIQFCENKETKIIINKLINIIAIELDNYISIDEIISSLEQKDKNIYKNIKTSKEDTKKIAIMNCIINAIKQGNEKINNSYNSMPLANINTDNIVELEFYDILEKIMPQILNIIEEPLKTQTKNTVREVLKDGKIFSNLTNLSQSIIKKEKNQNTTYIDCCKKCKALYEEYQKEPSLNNLIDSIVAKIVENKITMILNDFYSYSFTDKIKAQIINDSKDVELSLEDVEEHIEKESYYSRILAIVPYEEFIELIKETSGLKYTKKQSKTSKTILSKKRD